MEKRFRNKIIIIIIIIIVIFGVYARLASTADITSGLQLGRVEVLRGLGNFLNMDRFVCWLVA